MNPVNWIYVVIVLAIVQIIPFIVYGVDKRLAKSGSRRVPELILLVLTFVFGILGSLLAMILFRHKTSKGSFIAKFVGSSILRVLVLGSIIALVLFVL